MFSRPDVAKGYSDLLLNRPEFEAQASRMFDNLNEIRISTGRGEGGLSDKLLNPLEDTVELMNFANRWQEHLVRRGVFFSELQRLAKKEYNIDENVNLQKIIDNITYCNSQIFILENL